jgi:hypothetical protein
MTETGMGIKAAVEFEIDFDPFIRKRFLHQELMHRRLLRKLEITKKYY